MARRATPITATAIAAAFFSASCGWFDSAEVSKPPAADQTATPAPAPLQDDEWLGKQVQARFFTDDTVKDVPIGVSAEAGVITLTGSVATEAQRSRAEALAKEVEGVSRVDNQLGVAAAAAGQEGAAQGAPGAEAGPGVAKTMVQGVDNAWITTKVQAQYFLDPGVKALNVEVSTDGKGVVTLSGEVDSEAAHQQAVKLARSTEGVKDVVDRLRVRGEAPGRTQPAPGQTASGAIADAWITAKVQARYFLDETVKGRRINVDTRDGVVTLTGQVGTPGERRLAAELARNTDGVKSVQDQLTLTVPATTAQVVRDSRIDAATATGTGAAGATPPDGWITTRVQASLYVSDAVRKEPIEVTTARGVVTLSGRVSSEQARETAEEIAKATKGVTRVVNQLTVGEGTAAALPPR